MTKSEVGPSVLLMDRRHRYNYPLERLFGWLTEAREAWLRLSPGEIVPDLVDVEPYERVVWGSLWPVSPGDRIELSLSTAGEGFPLRCRAAELPETQSILRARWFSPSPPDERGVGISRHRLQCQFGANLRAVTSHFYWEGC